uniref:Uncharacterized protein n=1 Tax=Rhizophora mucronata TaxID=61149 RepID=A0A2P2NHD4_RHIMU
MAPPPSKKNESYQDGRTTQRRKSLRKPSRQIVVKPFLADGAICRRHHSHLREEKVHSHACA